MGGIISKTVGARKRGRASNAYLTLNPKGRTPPFQASYLFLFFLGGGVPPRTLPRLMLLHSHDANVGKTIKKRRPGPLRTCVCVKPDVFYKSENLALILWKSDAHRVWRWYLEATEGTMMMAIRSAWKGEHSHLRAFYFSWC